MLGGGFPDNPSDSVGAASVAKLILDQFAGTADISLPSASRLAPLPQGCGGDALVHHYSGHPPFLIRHQPLLPMECEHTPASISQGGNGGRYGSSAKRGRRDSTSLKPRLRRKGRSCVFFGWYLRGHPGAGATSCVAALGRIVGGCAVMACRPALVLAGCVVGRPGLDLPACRLGLGSAVGSTQGGAGNHGDRRCKQPSPARDPPYAISTTPGYRNRPSPGLAW